MDTLFWIGVLGIIFILLFLPWYLLRVRTSGKAGQARHASLTSQGAILSTSSVPGDADDYIAAIRSGDPVKIAHAPLPKLFSAELLLEGLIRLQSQPSLIDRFINRIHQQLTLWQYRAVASSWTRYENSLGEAVRAQNYFLSQISQRLNAHLEHELAKRTLQAKIEVQKFLAAQHGQVRKDLVKPKEQEQEREKRDELYKYKKPIELLQLREKVREIYRAAGLTEEDRVWQVMENDFENQIENLFKR